MAKTYTLTSTSMNVGNGSTYSNAWSAVGLTSGSLRIGWYNSRYYYTNILFNASTLATLRSKTVTAIKLRVTATYGQKSETTNYYQVRYKLNSVASAGSNYDAWASSNAASTAEASTYIGALTASDDSDVSGSYTWEVDLTGTSVPVYGYVLGCPAIASTRQRYLILASSATLLVTTNETDYTLKLSYNANGGTGAPSAQSATVTTTGTPSYTFTVSNTVPTRTNYTFLGWSTSASATSATYVGGQTITISANTTLYAVWRPNISVVSAPNGTLASALTISITRYDSSFTHTLTYKYGNATGTIATGVATSRSWTPPISLASQFPNAASGTCRITCETFDGSTSLGTSYVDITLAIPSTYNGHTIAYVPNGLTLADSNSDIATQFGVFVQGKSRAVATATFDSTYAYGATLASISIALDGQTLTSNGATSSYLNTVGTGLTATVTVVDTRGRSNTFSTTYDVAAYSNPTMSASAQRDSSTPSSVMFSYNWTISSVNDHNDKTLTVQYKLITATSYTTATTITLSSYSGNGTYTLTGTDENATYDVMVTVMDYFQTISVADKVAATGNRILDGSPVDKTIAFNMSNPSDGSNHFGKHTMFHDDIDNVQRRCYASLSSAGWYRVLTYVAEDSGGAMGGQGLVVDFNIVRATNAENHSITMRCVSGGGVSFTNESSKSNTQLIDKIRYAYNNDTYEVYVDIHYTGTAARDVGVFFNVYAATLAYEKAVTSDNLTAVADAPSGETVVTTYEFSANTETDGTITAYSGFTFSEIVVRQSGNIVQVKFYVAGTFAAKTGYDVGKVSGVSLPAAYHRQIVGCGAHNYDAFNGCYLNFTPTGVITLRPSVACSVVDVAITYIV